VKVDAERASFWLGHGAQASDTVRSLLKKASAATAQAPAATAQAPAAEAPQQG
jgi:ribosomal protein S16